MSIAGIVETCPPPAPTGSEALLEWGTAAARLGLVLRSARQDGAALALVVSENGAAFYEKQGFRALPATEAACRTAMPAPWPKEPPWVDGGDPFTEVPGLRTGTPDDLEALAAIHREAIAGQRFRIERDRATWDRALSEISSGQGLPGDAVEQLLVIEERGRVTAYALSKRTPEALRWREHGARPGSEARLIDLFWCALARARPSGVQRIEGWFLPPAPPGGAFYPIARRTRKAPVVMWRALDPDFDLPRFKREEDCRVFELDRF